VAQSPSKDNDFIKNPVMQKNQIISTTTILQNGFERPNLLDFAYTIWLVWCNTVAYSVCEVHIRAKSADWSEKNGDQ
jgi:hypothetical protein